jgi:amidohydrolase
LNVRHRAAVGSDPLDSDSTDFGATDLISADPIARWTVAHEADLIAFRRDLRAHPELSWREYRTTAALVDRLRSFGLDPQVLDSGTGLVCDVGTGDATVALRADIDALPLQDFIDAPYRSLTDGVCHACGHDVHTAVLLGAAGALAALPTLPGRVRLIFQPAEEDLPGGAMSVVKSGALDGVISTFAVHCDPRLAVGRIGTRVGPITAAYDKVEVRLTGPGGHTARPHLTADLVFTLGKIITEVPAMLSRRVDARAGMLLVWGAVNAGVAPNTIPREGTLRGTVRVLDRDVWSDAETVVRTLVQRAAEGTRADVEILYDRGVPPVVNEPGAVDVQQEAARAVVGEAGLAVTEQSMGGEDFGWYGEHTSAALARLGTQTPGTDAAAADLHQGTFDVDEKAVGIGARFMATSALIALQRTR